MRTFLLAIAAAVVISAVYVLVMGQARVSDSADATEAANAPPRVVLFIGDGMGLATVTAARIERGTLLGLPHPSEGRLRIDDATDVALVRTHSADLLVTDSAAAATAILTGHKVPNGVVCVVESGADRSPGASQSGSGPFSTAGDTLVTVLEIAKAGGLGTGVVTTTRVTHATPACAYAHVPDRNQEEDIAAALVPGRGNPRLGDGIDVVLGGGARNFLPRRPGTDGRREDGRDLLGELASAGYGVVRNRSELATARAAGTERVLGLFSPSHMTYGLDREAESPDEPTLVEMVEAAVGILERNPNGFFLLVEGGRIDHAHHETNGRRAVEEMLEFDDAIGWTVDRLGKDAIILVTADHDHAMVLAGYAEAKAGVFSQAGTDRDGTPYTTILYANGPGGDVPKELTPEILRDPDFRERAGVPLGSETHGGTDVPLYIFGPADQTRSVRGTIDNTDLFGFMRDAIVRER